VKPLVVKPHRRTWGMCSRVCVVCGETHAVGQPTPSGRECKQVQPTRYVPTRAKIGRPPKVAVDRTCKVCGVAKATDQFNGLHSFRCLACWEEVKAQSVVKQQLHNATWRANNAEKVKAINAKGNKRWREKQKIKKEATK
jgi:hypothetical protein